MNVTQRTAVTSAIQIISSSRQYSTRPIVRTLRAMLDDDDSDELRSTDTLRKAIAIEVEVLDSALNIYNEAMQAIGKARANGHAHVAGALATEAVCVLGDRLTRTRSLLSRLADGRK